MTICFATFAIIFGPLCLFAFVRWLSVHIRRRFATAKPAPGSTRRRPRFLPRAEWANPERIAGRHWKN